MPGGAGRQLKLLRCLFSARSAQQGLLQPQVGDCFQVTAHRFQPAFLPTTPVSQQTLGMATGRITREWEGPSNGGAAPTHKLELYNSLVDAKVPFVPAAGPSSTQITWYTCGPTVYDSAHMGHARNYVTFDILRRVLEDYFGYNIQFVMNVTDVDDKIILRARRNYLLQQYRKAAHSTAEARAYAEAAVNAAHSKQSKKVEEAEASLASTDAEISKAGSDAKELQAKRVELETAVKNERHKLDRIKEAQAGLAALPPSADVDALLEVASDFVAEALDKERGSSVTDGSIFRAHAAKYEREFMEDMDVLGCRPPTVLTRVSEYIPEIVKYVEVIVANGMAYESNGSVYFDTQKFRSCGHTYGKLKPWAVGSALLAAEGESNFETSEKRCPLDFALWKASKPGEPMWDSPWGKGRPGWHIECSAMASSIFGSRMDIHSGGEDLRFPHHDNELAQAEAHYHHEGCRQWVNYFLHSGHLEIEGLKMSKSLKNFITIKDALKAFSPRQLRIMFALQQWNKPMMYGEQAKTELKAREAQLKNFFQNVEVAVRGAGDQTTTSARWEAAEVELSTKLASTQDRVHAALCNNLDTPSAMDALSDLVKAVNIYLAKQQEAGRIAQPLILGRCTAYVTRILSTFGIVMPVHDRPGLSEATDSGDTKGPAYLDALSAFRDEVRSLAKSKGSAADMAAVCERARATLQGHGVSFTSNGKPGWSLTVPEGTRSAGYLRAFAAFHAEVEQLTSQGAEPGKVLAACDSVRDLTLVDLGVRLEDRPDGRAIWKLDDPATLRAEIEERARAAAEAAKKKVAGALERKMKEKEKFDALVALPPIEVALADKFSKFDPASGEPTHDKDGAELDGKARDKARKDWEKQRKIREPLTKKLAEDPSFLSALDKEIQELTQQLAAMDTAGGAPQQNGNSS